MSDIRASHILLGTESRDKDEALKAIESLKKEIDGGADFAKLAKEHSDCPSGSDGGDLGEFSPGMMVPEFDKAAFDLEVDEVSGPVETSFGYHLIVRTA